MRCTGHIINLSVTAFLGALAKDFDFEAYKPVTRDHNITTDELQDTKKGSKKPNIPTKSRVHHKDTAEVKRWHKLGPLGVLHNVITYIMASPQRRQIWKQKYCPELLLLKDNTTRWNSWYSMIKRALDTRVKEALRQYMMDYRDELSATLSNSDWEFLTNMHSFLEAFLDATKSIESDSELLAGVLWTMDYLRKHYKATLNVYPGIKTACGNASKLGSRS